MHCTSILRERRIQEIVKAGSTRHYCKKASVKRGIQSRNSHQLHWKRKNKPRVWMVGVNPTTSYFLLMLLYSSDVCVCFYP